MSRRRQPSADDGDQPGDEEEGFFGRLTSKIAAASTMALTIPAIVIVLMISIIGSTLSNVTRPPLDGGISPIDEIQQFFTSPEQLADIQEAALANDIPWTVLAAVIILATEAGKFSPYDDDLIDRDPRREGIRRPNQGTVTGSAGTLIGGISIEGINPVVAAAYVNAAERIPTIVPGAKITPGIIAAFGRVESGHATHGGATVSPTGDVDPPIIGIQLNGTRGTARIADTDRGQLDGDTVFDRAVGPAQFIPSTWKAYGLDGNGDGVIDPQNVFDAFLTNAHHITRNGNLDVTVEANLRKAAYAYNRSQSYVQSIVDSARRYDALFSAAGSAGADTGGIPLGPITVIGDSLCEPGPSAEVLANALRSAGWQPTLDCVRGRPLSGAAENLIAAAAARGPVIASLGTNDAAGNPDTFKPALERVRQAVGTTPIVWVNVATRQPGAEVINTALNEALGRWPSLRIADFASVVNAQPELLAPDGVHLRGDGPSKRAATITAAASGSGGAQTIPGMSKTYPPNPEGLKVSAFPTVTPPIGGDSTPGVGPYLLVPRVLDGAKAPDPQRIGLGRRSATEFLAAEIARTAKEVKKDNLKPGSSRADTEAFWTEVIRRLPIADPRQSVTNCAPPPISTLPSEDIQAYQMSVGTTIASVWRCVLDSSPSVTTLSGPRRVIPAGTATSLVVDEALDVAWAFSSWGSRDCDPAAPLAGVFPLTAEVFSAHRPAESSGDRCDPVANITAAVSAFVAGESETPGSGIRSSESGTYAPMFGGWLAMPWALGDEASRNSFAQSGRTALNRSDPSCAVLISEALLKAETDTTLPGGEAVVLDTLRAQTQSTACSNPPVFAATLAEAVDARRAALEGPGELYEGGDGDAGIDSPSEAVAPISGPAQLLSSEERQARVARLAALISTLSSTTPVAGFRGGTDSSVQRLSASGRRVPGRPALVGAPQDSRGQFASALVGLAAALGGFSEDDIRTGDDPKELIRRFWGASSSGGFLTLQGDVSPDMCPTAAAPNTLRGGAEAVGVNEICRKSVLAAPTPEAARAIIMALSPDMLGKPYSQPNRTQPGWFDCSSYVSRAYRAAGVNIGSWPPTTALFTAGVPWARRIDPTQWRPGDIALEPAPGHAVMLLADGWMVHTNRTGDVSHVKRAYPIGNIDLVLRVHPEIAGPTTPRL